MIVDGAAFTVWAADPEPRITQLGQPAQRVRCASVLKPLYFWAASTLPAFRDDADGWAELAEPAVTVSSNDPTVEEVLPIHWDVAAETISRTTASLL